MKIKVGRKFLEENMETKVALYGLILDKQNDNSETKTEAKTRFCYAKRKLT